MDTEEKLTSSIIPLCPINTKGRSVFMEHMWAYQAATAVLGEGGVME